MTRETKIGLVVALSFLLLVSVVVGARLWQGGPPARRYNADDVILKTLAAPKSDQAKPTAAATPKQTDAPPTPLHDGIRQTAGAVDPFRKVSDDEQQRMLRSLSDAVNNPEETIPIPKRPFGDVALPEPPLAFNDAAPPPPPPVPQEAVKPKDQKPPAPQPKQKEEGTPPAPPPLPVDDLPPAPDPNKGATAPLPPVTPPPVKPVTPPGASPPKPPDDSFGLPPTPAALPQDPPNVQIPDPLPKSNDGKPLTLPVPPSPTLPAPPPTTPPERKIEFPLPPTTPPERKIEIPLPLTEKKNDFPLPPVTEPPPVIAPSVAPPSVPPPGLKPTVNTPIPLPMQDERVPDPHLPPHIPMPVLPTVKPMADPGPVVIKPLPPKNVESSLPPEDHFPTLKPATIPVPPPVYPANSTPTKPGIIPAVGAQPPVTSPPIRIPTAPQVRSYDVREYKVEVGDNSFADISQKVYRSESYGRALLTFNREYPLTADTYRKDPPQLAPGQVVVWPPLDILTAKYGSLVGDPGPRAQASFSASNDVDAGAQKPTNPQFIPAQPPPQPPAQGNPAAAAPALSGKQWVAADGARMYRVGGNGESLLQIAQQVLGNSQRWSDIYRLNPDLRPEFPIPAGRDIRLPVQSQ